MTRAFFKLPLFSAKTVSLDETEAVTVLRALEHKFIDDERRTKLAAKIRRRLSQ